MVVARKFVAVPIKRFRVSSLVMLLLLMLFFLGCASSPSSYPVDSKVIASILSGHSLLGDKARTLPLPEHSLFTLTEEMREFAEAYTQGEITRERKAIALNRALLGSSALNFDYNPYQTYTAEQAFRHQRGNCLAYTALYVAMAEHIGLNVWINEVDVPATWGSLSENTFVYFRHVNTKVGLRGGDSLVIDLDMENYDASYKQRRISKAATEAQYYNNKAVELLNEGDIEQTYAYLRKGVMLAPSKPYVWNNMGILYRRQGLLVEAEAAFLTALNFSLRSVTAASNLSQLYRLQNKPELSAMFAERAHRHRQKNPYYLNHQAQQLLEEKNYQQALAVINRAIKYHDGEHRFYFTKGKILARLQRYSQAKKSLEKAIDIAVGVQQKSRYRELLEQL